MIERIELFAPSLLVVSTIALFCYFYPEIVPKHFKLVLFTDLLIFAPTADELLFRAPLLILFSQLSPSAWGGIIALALGYGLLHWLKEERFKSTAFAATLLLGIITGFSVVYAQSIWAGVAIHFVWNLIPLASLLRGLDFSRLQL